MVIAHVTTGTALSSSAQNLLIDEVNALRDLIEVPDPFVQKSSTDNITSSTTLISDSQLILSLTTGLWRVVANIGVAGPAAGDIKLAWLFGGGAAQASTRQCRGPATNNAGSDTTSMRMSQHNWTTAIAYGCDGSLTSAVEEIGMVLVTGSSGTMTLQFAQNTSNASATSVTSNSYAYARRVDI